MIESRNKMHAIRRLLVMMIVAIGAFATGCNTNLNEILFESAAATGRTALDLWLTDFENRVADVLDPNPT
ncbi:MAG: hypothetical protein HY287_01470 [Planctomycetes bacterium]|nr:hypothetical protein [Planctomycetota bacterium]MBI3832977.1 hypothetical protein [Planctomycetota bacterium]